MTDKELIELAAKAAGITGTWHRSGYVAYSGWSGSIFDPLNDDGDAFRLAVKLKIKFERHIAHPFVAAFATGIVGRFEEQEGEDACSATRRAITRSAAQIGKEVE